MKVDFTNFYKKRYGSPGDFISDNEYDLFVSAYNDSERVKKLFDEVKAKEKHWLVFPEYRYTKEEQPQGEGAYVYEDLSMREGKVIRDYFGKIGDLKGKKVCIDITGFIRPHLVFAVRYLATLDLQVIDFIYTDPIAYKQKENTEFSSEYTDVRQVEGCWGTHDSDTSNDFLIIGSGFDHLRIMDVSKKKASAKKVQLFGFPSLQPDMFQQNILKAYKAEEESSLKSFNDKDLTLYAPANDPFVTASVLCEFVEKENSRKKITNLYLSPLSTKAQTLGFALYYLSECLTGPVSVIFPFCNYYSKETTEGIAKIWKYSVNFQALKSIAV